MERKFPKFWTPYIAVIKVHSDWMEVETCNRLWEELLRGHKDRNSKMWGSLTIYVLTEWKAIISFKLLKLATDSVSKVLGKRRLFVESIFMPFQKPLP